MSALLEAHLSSHAAPMHAFRLPRASRRVSLPFKRLIDVVGASSALFLLAPLLLLLALVIRVDSRGPALFRQRRIGAHGKPFTILKFRSMVADAEAQLAALRHRNQGSGVLFKLQDDPRVTRVGKLIRKYSLDELPQFVNVLRGEMSLVGPRPALPSEVAAYDRRALRRLTVRPGITGAWQVGGRSDLDWDQGLSLDLDYIDHWSHSRDIRILMRTATHMIRPRGAY